MSSSACPPPFGGVYFRRSGTAVASPSEDRDERVLVLGRAVMDEWIKAYEVQLASEDGDSDTDQSSLP
jgi:hypothetical protein